MRLVTGPRLLLLPTLGLALACASPKSADAPAAERSFMAQQAKDDPSAPPVAERERDDEVETKTREEPSAIAPSDERPTPPSTSKLPQPEGSSLVIAVPMINGGLDRDIIRRTASDHADDIQSCHGRALAAMPELAGIIVVKLALDPDGRVSEAELGESSAFTSREVEDCVLALVHGWQFPAPRKGERVSAELTFELGPR
jgi:outer membrane biosynthesis protein TonB